MHREMSKRAWRLWSAQGEGSLDKELDLLADEGRVRPNDEKKDGGHETSDFNSDSGNH